jgi:Holliday junction resolvase RusA-like endonuclease
MTISGDLPPRIGNNLVNNAQLEEAIKAELPDFAQIKEILVQAYSSETGIQGAGDEEIASWIRQAMRENPDFKGLCVDKTPPRFIMFPDLAMKFDYVAQRPCLLCLPYQKVQYIRFQLHTAPVSRQVDRQMAFKRAVRDYLDRVRHDFSDFYHARLCVAVTFALRLRGRIADVDNLTKTLLDALQGYAYANDRQIDHLDLVRLSSNSEDSFISVRVAVTGIADNVDAVRPVFDVQWVGSGIAPIDLTPYLPLRKRERK